MTDPQPHFDDRLLTCADCHAEFIFTAGEQLFFHDKQFKNDPKRCKPCKSRRSGLAAVANGTGPVAAGLSRTETRTECSECGIQTTVPFKPTQGRPVLCRQCFQVKNKAVKPAELPALETPPPLAAAPTPYEVAEATTRAYTLSTLTEVSATSNGSTLSAEAATLAVAAMSSASPQSSIASAADLASIVAPETPASPAPAVPRLLLAQAAADQLTGNMVSAELLAASADAPKA